MEFAPTRRKQMANVEVNSDEVTLFLWVALRYIADIGELWSIRFLGR